MSLFAIPGLRAQASALRSGGQRKIPLPDAGPDPTDGEAACRAFRARQRELSGERRLVLAVFMAALDDLRYPLDSKPYAAAFHWLVGNDEQWPLAFRPACATLELDPDAVRARLRATVATGTPVAIAARPPGRGITAQDRRPPVLLCRAAS